MDKAIKEILRQAYIENGESVFLNSDKLKGVLADKLYNYPIEKKRLYLAINENIVYKLFTESDETRYKAYARILTDTYAFPYNIACEIIEVFAYAKDGRGITIETRKKEDVFTENNITQEKKHTVTQKPEDNSMSTKKTNNADSSQIQKSNQNDRYTYLKTTKTIARAILVIFALFLIAIPIINSLNTNTYIEDDYYVSDFVTESEVTENNIIHSVGI